MGGADVEVGGKGGASGIYVGGAEAGVEEGVSTLWCLCRGHIEPDCEAMHTSFTEG